MLALFSVGMWVWLCVCVLSLVCLSREMSVCFGGCLFVSLSFKKGW